MLVSVWVPMSRESFDHIRVGSEKAFTLGRSEGGELGSLTGSPSPSVSQRPPWSPPPSTPSVSLRPCLAAWYSIGLGNLLPCASQFKPHLQAKFALPIAETSDTSSEESGLQWGTCQEKLKSLSNWERGGTLFWDGWNVLQRKPHQEPSRLSLGLPADLG